MADDVVENVEIDLTLRDAASAGLVKIEAGFESLGRVAREFNKITEGLSGPLAQIAGGVGFYEVIRKSTEEASKLELVIARLKTAAGGSDSLVQQMKDLSKALSDKSVFAGIDLLQAAADLLARGVPQSQLTKSLQATIELASALRISLDQAAREIAQTFGGIVTRDLGQALPQLRAMTTESLRLGAAVNTVLEKFSGQAAAAASTPAGKVAQETNQLNEQFEDLGGNLLKLQAEVLPAFIQIFQQLNEALSSPAGEKFFELLGRAIPVVLKIGLGLAAISATVRALGPLNSIWNAMAAGIAKVEAATTAATAATQNLTKAQIRMRERQEAYRTQNIAGGLATAAGGILGYQEGGAEGAVVGSAIGAAAGALPGPLALIGIAGLVADALYTLGSKLLGINTDFDSFDKQVKLASDVLNDLAKDRQDHQKGTWVENIAANLIASGLGIALPTAHLAAPPDPNADANAQIAADNAAAPKGGDLIAAHNAEQLRRWNELLKQMADLEKQEHQKTSDEIDGDDEKANKQKLERRGETFGQYMAQEYSLEKKGIDDRAEYLREQINKLREEATRDEAGGLHGNALQNEAQAIALQTEYNGLLLKQDQLTEKLAADTLKLADQQAQLAARALEKRLGSGRTRVGSGEISPEAGSADASAALADYNTQIQGIRSGLAELSKQPGEIGAEATQAIKDLDEEAAAIADKTRTAISDVRSAAEAGHDAAVTLQKDFQEGIGKTLDDIIEKTKTVRQAFKDLGKDLLHDTVHQATSRLSELITGGASGGSSGGGIFGAVGKAATGDAGGLIGGISNLIFGSQPAEGGTGGKTGGAGGSTSAGQTGGIVNLGLGILKSLLGAFDSGGYTGGSPGQIAGIVHGGEYVVPAGVVSSMGGPSVMSQFFSKAYPSTGGRNLSLPGGSSGKGMADNLEIMAKSAAAGGGGGQTIYQPAIAVDEDMIKQINYHPSSARIQADMMLKNPSSFGPAVKMLGK